MGRKADIGPVSTEHLHKPSSYEVGAFAYFQRVGHVCIYDAQASKPSFTPSRNCVNIFRLSRNTVWRISVVFTEKWSG